MLFFKLVIARITVPHAEKNTSIYEITDPAVLLVSKEHPSKVLTLFDYSSLSQKHLPIGLHELENEILKFQLWHAYYDFPARNFFLELEYDKAIKTELQDNGTLFQAVRGNSTPKMRARSLDHGKFFEIVFDNKCLTVDATKSKERDSYPLRFKPCVKSENQTFTFASKMLALCKLGNELCPGNEGDLTTAEAIVLKKLAEFIS
ncbi:hypothetical protein H312_02652 [Anncaliia algerae PRA339]|uniref:Ricin B lectin domain-containing protein n=1 Tax=Anncaliia algerae PRA339 TaxID=1288291 RepID=A0A059EY49_9MICR|nr:hypothetical protein H312_02652 [Anncaliia algerae PRA339]